MPTSAGGHKPDKIGTKKPIDERLWREAQALIPQSWKVGQKLAEEVLYQHGLPRPEKLPFYMGKVTDPSGHFPNGIKVFLVDGNKIMREHDMDFNQGANGYEDPKLFGGHKDEIFLDYNIPVPAVEDLKFIIQHEAEEGPNRMQGGMSYDAAHVIANNIERQLRIRMLDKQGQEE